MASVMKEVPAVMTDRQAAQFLGTTVRTLFELRRSGNIPFFRVGKAGRGIRYRLAALEQWCKQQEELAAQEIVG